jgi:hypothetical protein
MTVLVDEIRLHCRNQQRADSEGIGQGRIWCACAESGVDIVAAGSCEIIVYYISKFHMSCVLRLLNFEQITLAMNLGLSANFEVRPRTQICHLAN